MKYVKQFSIILGISFWQSFGDPIPFPIAANVYGLVITGRADHEADPTGRGGDRSGIAYACPLSGTQPTVGMTWQVWML